MIFSKNRTKQNKNYSTYISLSAIIKKKQKVLECFKIQMLTGYVIKLYKI